MQTITITFGRNVGTEPLSVPRWAQFQADVRSTLTTGSAGSEVFFGTCQNEWNGQAEESACAVFVGEWTPNQAELLQSVLRAICDFYDQEAIGFAIAHNELLVP